MGRIRLFPQRRVRAAVVTAASICMLVPGVAEAQSPMPAVGDTHFCGWWQAKVGPAAVKPKPEHQEVSVMHRLMHRTKAETKQVEPVEAPVGVEGASDPDQVAALTDPQVMAAMGCLLQLENDGRATRFGGGARMVAVSQVFGPAPVKLAALLYTSYLFTRNLNAFGAVALRGPDAQDSRTKSVYVTSDEAIAKAYISYRHWYDDVRRMGLARAREENLDPLSRTGLYWY